MTTSASSGVTTGGATLNGGLTSLGSATSASVDFEYGLTSSYGSVTSAQTMTGTGAFSAGLTGLTAGTTYHYRADATGSGTSYGADQTFTTAPIITPPSVTTNAATYIARNSATLNGSLTGLGTSGSVGVSFQLGLTTSYGSSTSILTMSTTGSFAISISGLASGTTFHYRAVAVGTNGLIAYGSDQVFTTTTKGKP